MNEHAKKWVEALRSGEFEQGYKKLRRDDHYYCCLGVACELYRLETGDGKWSSKTNDLGDRFITNDEINASLLPSAVGNWLGLRNLSGGYDEGTEDTEGSCLADDNDGGATFEQIAATIEAEPTGLFQGEAGL